MRLLANNWKELKIFHLQLLGAKAPGKIRAPTLISKIWDVAWDFWNFRNHNLRASYGPRKIDLIELINKRVNRHLENGRIGLPIKCHFLYQTSIQTLITRLIWKCLSWLSATTSARRCFRTHASQRRLPDTDELLLGIITMERLISDLSHTDTEPPLQTTIGYCTSCSLYIER